MATKKNISNIRKFRIDIRRSKRGSIVESYWCETWDSNEFSRNYVSIYEKVGKRMRRVASLEPNS